MVCFVFVSGHASFRRAVLSMINVRRVTSVKRAESIFKYRVDGSSLDWICLIKSGEICAVRE